MSRILLVDDSDDIRRSVGAVLQDAIEGAALGEAASGAEALALVTREPWDVVLLDLSLPDRSGLDVLREMRRLRPAVPVLVMSFHTEAEYAAAARGAGAAGYLTKGSAAGAIAVAVEAALSSPAPPPAARSERAE